jgi:hypothetical protein
MLLVQMEELMDKFIDQKRFIQSVFKKKE